MLREPLGTALPIVIPVQLALLSLIISCSDGVQTEAGCVSGSACFCPDGQAGNQTCFEDNTFGPCDCPSDTGADVQDEPGDAAGEDSTATADLAEEARPDVLRDAIVDTVDVSDSTYEEEISSADLPWFPTPCVVERDEDGDGDIDVRVVITHDGDGNAVSSDTDEDNDGDIDSRGTFTWDAYGNPVLSEYDTDNDGDVDRRHAYTYDENGNRLSQESDYDGDDIVDYRMTSTYDAQNHLLSRVEDYGDSLPVERLTLMYDLAGNLVLVNGTVDEDDTIVYRQAFSYSEDNELTSMEIDHGNDGYLDWRARYTYDSDGNLLYWENLNNDGDVTRRVTHSHDGDGNLVMQATDEDADGAFEYVLTYTYDPAGNTLSAQGDLPDSDEFDFEVDITYDSAGNILSMEYDEGADGTVDYLRSLEYGCWNENPNPSLCPCDQNNNFCDAVKYPDLTPATNCHCDTDCDSAYACGVDAYCDRLCPYLTDPDCSN